MCRLPGQPPPHQAAPLLWGSPGCCARSLGLGSQRLWPCRAQPHEEAREHLEHGLCVFSASLRNTSAPGSPASMKEEARMCAAARFPFWHQHIHSLPRLEAVTQLVLRPCKAGEEKTGVRNFSGRVAFWGSCLTRDEKKSGLLSDSGEFPTPDHYRQSRSLRCDHTKMFTAEILLRVGKASTKGLLGKKFPMCFEGSGALSRAAAVGVF